MNLELLNEIDSFVWGPPLLVLLVGTGVFLSLRLGFLQVARLPKALGLIFKAKSQGEGDTSSFRALCTALAATIGTGNIVGVATAVKAGGPGALFWMWVAAFFGMATKYAEGLLAVKYRGVDEHGEIAGGPMFYIENGMGRQWKPLAVFFAAAGVLVAYFGIGTFAQVNSIVDITKLSIGLDPMYTAVVLTLAVAAVTIGGLQSIASVASKIVPAMAVIYFVATVGFLLMFIDKVPGAVMEVLRCAFTPTAAAGGFAGASVMLAMRSGVARGVFSNESGLGSAPIVAAAAQTKSPVRQALVSSTGTFWDTVVVCLLTGMVIVSSVLAHQGITFANGATLTKHAFATIPVIGTPLLTFGIITFAFSTILGWSYYGEKCVEYLGGSRFSRYVIWIYRVLFILMVFVGGTRQLDAVWSFSDLANGLMAIPNLISLLLLTGVIARESRRGGVL